MSANSPDRIVAIGEAKWRAELGDVDQLTRLEHLRELLKLPPGVKVLVFSRAGFTDRLTRAGDARPDVELIDVHRLYTGS